MLKSGELVAGKYRVLSEIGRGGECVVYLALDERENQIRAIKTLLEESGPDGAERRHRLSREAELLRQLRHPCLPGVRETVLLEGRLLVIMDYIDGVPLAKQVADRGPMTWREAVRVAIELCEVLSYLHSRDNPILYGDLQPGNIQLRPNGSITLLDFGTAREYGEEAQSGSAQPDCGTEGYAAPELYRSGAAADVRTDIYGMGAVLFFLVIGQHPHLPEGGTETVLKRDGRMPWELRECILRCMEEDPELRYQSCSDLLWDLRAIQNRGRRLSREKRVQMACFFVCAAMAILFAAGAVTAKAAQSVLSRQLARPVLEESFSPDREGEEPVVKNAGETSVSGGQSASSFEAGGESREGAIPPGEGRDPADLGDGSASGAQSGEEADAPIPVLSTLERGEESSFAIGGQEEEEESEDELAAAQEE